MLRREGLNVSVVEATAHYHHRVMVGRVGGGEVTHRDRIDVPLEVDAKHFLELRQFLTGRHCLTQLLTELGIHDRSHVSVGNSRRLSRQIRQLRIVSAPAEQRQASVVIGDQPGPETQDDDYCGTGQEETGATCHGNDLCIDYTVPGIPIVPARIREWKPFGRPARGNRR